jgi:galactokinase
MILQRTDSELNQHEHEVLRNQLRNLDTALDGLVCYSEVFADLGSANEVYRWGNQIRRGFPDHVLHEERSVLDVVAAQDPDWQTFAQEMKRQHRDLLHQLETFCESMDELEDSPDLEQCIAELKTRGQEFARQLAGHMSAEERKLSRMTNA